MRKGRGKRRTVEWSNSRCVRVCVFRRSSKKIGEKKIWKQVYFLYTPRCLRCLPGSYTCKCRASPLARSHVFAVAHETRAFLPTEVARSVMFSFYFVFLVSATQVDCSLFPRVIACVIHSPLLLPSSLLSTQVFTFAGPLFTTAGTFTSTLLILLLFTECSGFLIVLLQRECACLPPRLAERY